MKWSALALAATAASWALPAHAHKIIEPGFRDKIARNTFSASPESEWNRLQQKEGKYQESWTRDGDDLNEITFFGGVPIDEPLFTERNKKDNPLPKVTANMLVTDIPVLLEATYRTHYGTPQMQVGRQEPVEIDGRPGIRFTYSFVRSDDEVERRGEAIGAFADGKLYLVTYEAPALYFFERDVAKFRQIAGTLTIRD